MSSDEMRSQRPAWVADNYPSYEDMVASWGYEVLAFDTHGSYQGDHTVLMRDGARHGFTMIGYGSCSGCDALDAAAPWDDDGDWSQVAALSDELRATVRWSDSALSLAAWLRERVATEGKGTDWYWYDDEVKAQALTYAERLSADPSGATS